MKRLILFLCLLSVGFLSYGQRTIKGIVTDEAGEPLIGANEQILAISQNVNFCNYWNNF